MRDETKLADDLLTEWYDWTRTYRPALGAERVSPYCRQATSSRQWEDSTEASCGRLHINEMQSVAFCVDTLPVANQQAIGLEMRNRMAKAKAWRAGQPNAPTYAQTVVLILPIMRKRGLFD